MKLALLFDYFGPYHLARQRGAVAAGLNVIGVEYYARSKDYAWGKTSADGVTLETVCHHGEAMTKAEFRGALWKLLDRVKPDVVAIPGWSAAESLSALLWCLQHKVPSVLMSESCAHDEKRVYWKEFIKYKIVQCCSAALVGGSYHKSYLEKLGLAAEHIFLGYDVVDNSHFQTQQKMGSEMTFLASARFIPKKNLEGLMAAYSLYRKAVEKMMISPWDLLLLGDGEMRPLLERQVMSLGLQKYVAMPGFLQYYELPAQYAKAKTFIHVSTTEQWGLVVNEAMASGLPVLVSNRCGCTPDLVQDGVNGFIFDPYNIESITKLMVKMTMMSTAQRESMGMAGKEIISQWGPDRFGQGIFKATKTALLNRSRLVGVTTRLLIKILSSR